MALVLFGLVKLLKKVGLGNFGPRAATSVPTSKEFVAIDATTCKWCTADIEPGQRRRGRVSTQQRIG